MIDTKTVRAASRASFLAFIAWLPAAAQAGDIPNPSTPSAVRPALQPKRLDIPPRLQWRENFGYCGEVAMLSAGLYYGQYMSQYDARAIASPTTPQYRSSSQLLLGVNDAAAAAGMHLKSIAWHDGEGADAASFLTWVKRNVARDYPVLIGVYTNHQAFDGSDDARAGDPEYDHIVPVVGIASRNGFAPGAPYSGEDRVQFSDNGLWAPAGRPTYLFSETFDAFQKSRAQANARSAGPYSLAKQGAHYGIAITGVADEDRETVPVRVAVSRNDETPDIAAGSGQRPPAIPLTLTVEVSGLEAGVNYKLYRYDRMESVPDRAFNAHAGQAAKQWDIRIASGTSYRVTEQIESNRIAVYRAVRADAR